MYFCKAKLRFLSFLLESMFIGFTFYYVVIRSSSKVKRHSNGGETWKQRAGDIWSGSPRGPNQIMKMENCPEDWPLEIVRRASFDRTRQLAQVCRKRHGIGEWKCAPGWRAQVEDPYCVYTGIMLPATGVFEGPNANESHQFFGQISHKRQLIFVHLPHTGGNFIENSFLFNDSSKNVRHSHFGDDDQISDLDHDQYKSYHKFSVMRHPCSRLISAWKYLTEGSADYGDKLWATSYLDKGAMNSFNDFMLTTLSPGGHVNIRSQVHLRTQVSMLFDDKEQFRLDQLLVYEKWNESMAELGRRLNIDTSHLHSSYISSDTICKEMYTPSTWLKMTQIYTLDFCVLGYSRDMSQLGISPSPNRSPQGYLNRLQNCMRNLKEKRKSPTQLPTTKVMKKEESCIINTYFQKAPNVASKDVQEHKETIEVWKKTWSQMGWTPRILSEEDAKKHPDYEMLREKFFALPTINRKEYEMACFLRHVAMAAVGGGWMSDYDVTPLHMPRCVEPLNGGRYTVYEHYTPSLVSGSGDEFTRVSKMMADIDWRNHPALSDRDRPHVSDMHLFSLFVKNGSVEPMMVVIEARDIFTEPFLCNRTWKSKRPDSKPVPPEYTQLPWVIHFAHASFGTWREKKVASLWPGSKWNVTTLKENAVRPSVMMDAFDYLRNTCKIV